MRSHTESLASTSQHPPLVHRSKGYHPRGRPQKATTQAQQTSENCETCGPSIAGTVETPEAQTPVARTVPPGRTPARRTPPVNPPMECQRRRCLQHKAPAAHPRPKRPAQNLRNSARGRHGTARRPEPGNPGAPRTLCRLLMLLFATVRCLAVVPISPILRTTRFTN